MKDWGGGVLIMHISEDLINYVKIDKLEINYILN